MNKKKGKKQETTLVQQVDDFKNIDLAIKKKKYDKRRETM